MRSVHIAQALAWELVLFDATCPYTSLAHAVERTLLRKGIAYWQLRAEFERRPSYPDFTRGRSVPA